MLDKITLDYEVPDSGCCGMAGAFGFEADKYDVSIAVGERVLLPAVRQVAKDTLVIADGFSCRTQVQETTGRHALHLARILKMGLKTGPRGPAGNFPESDYIQPEPPIPSKWKTLVVLALAAFVVGGILGACDRGSGR